jgi:hypothetical protein
LHEDLPVGGRWHIKTSSIQTDRSNDVLWHRFCLKLDMSAENPKMKGCLYPSKPKRKPKHFPGSDGPDRRTGQDRRKLQNPDFFSEGGVERRSWKERRFLWYMTM